MYYSGETLGLFILLILSYSHNCESRPQQFKYKKVNVDGQLVCLNEDFAHGTLGIFSSSCVGLSVPFHVEKYKNYGSIPEPYNSTGFFIRPDRWNSSCVSTKEEMMAKDLELSITYFTYANSEPHDCFVMIFDEGILVDIPILSVENSLDWNEKVLFTTSKPSLIKVQVICGKLIESMLAIDSFRILPLSIDNECSNFTTTTTTPKTAPTTTPTTTPTTKPTSTTPGITTPTTPTPQYRY